MTAPQELASTAAGEAGVVAGAAKEQAGAVAGAATSAAGDVATTARDQAGAVVGETVTQAKAVTAQVKEQASQQLTTQAEKLTGGLRGLSRQLTEGDTSGAVGQVMTEVGGKVQALADHLERVGPQGLLEDVRRFARQSPGTFLLAAGLAGLVTGRLVKGATSAQQAAQPALPARPSPGGLSDGLPGTGAYASTGPAYTDAPYPDPLGAPATTVDRVRTAPLTGGLADPYATTTSPSGAEPSATAPTSPSTGGGW